MYQEAFYCRRGSFKIKKLDCRVTCDNQGEDVPLLLLTACDEEQHINELAGLRRPKILTRWALLMVVLTAGMGLLSTAADGWERLTDQIHDPCKDRICTPKFFSMDYASLDNQEVRDQFAQLCQNENWNGGGITRAIEATKNTIQSVMGILGAVALTVSRFTQLVPAGPYTWLNSPFLILALAGIMILSLGLVPPGRTFSPGNSPDFRRTLPWETVCILRPSGK